MTTTKEKEINITINDNTPTKVCFVCTGNTCRSPMAMAVLNALGGGKYKAISAGIMADKGAPINEKAAAALLKKGFEATENNNYLAHTAQQLNMGIMESCDLIVGVGAGHAMMILQYFPIFASKITSFDVNITDPFGCPQEVYDKCLSDIIDAVKSKFALTDGENK